MTITTGCLIILPFIIGYILDLWLGDPHHWPHPVCWMGNAIKWLQNKIRLFCQTERSLFLGGALLWIVIVGGTFVLTWGALAFLGHISFWLAFIAQATLAYTILATKSLKDAAMGVYQVLVNGSIEDARIQLSYIVGRDTTQLDKEQITRATVETVAENSVDGVIAPLFYLFLGGVPLAMAYKAVNTLDSMVGYKTPEYKAIGCVSARLDDVFNWIPARLSWLLLTGAAVFLCLPVKKAFKIGWRDRYQHKSPNCAWSEATVAGALEVRLGGPNTYFDTVVEKPWLGDDVRPIDQEDIKNSVNLMYLASLLSVVLFSVVYLILSSWI